MSCLRKIVIMNFMCHQLYRHNNYKIKAMQHMTEDMDMGFYDVKD